MDSIVPRPSNTYRILTFVFLTISIVLAVLLFKNYGSLKDETIAKNDAIGDKQELIVKLESLKHDYTVLSEEHAHIKELFEDEKQKIENLIRELKEATGSVEEYKKQIARLERKLKEYLKQIGDLKLKNQVITVKNVKLEAVLDSTMMVSKSLQGENQVLAKQVESAAVLRAYEKVAFAVKIRSGKEMPTTNAKKANKIKVCFVLSENPIVSKGLKNVYLRISSPEGKILYKNETDVFQYNKAEIQYSAKQEINYTGKAMDICMYFNDAVGLTEGVYEIDIFVDQHNVGTTACSLE